MWKSRLADRLLGHRRLIWATLLIIDLVALVLAARTGMDSSIEIWFLEGDPSIETYHQFLDRFGGDEIVAVGLWTDDVFKPSNLEAIDRLAREARAIPKIRRVTAITDVRVVQESDDGSIIVGPVVPKLPLDIQEAAAVRQKAMAHPLLDPLLTDDGRGTLVLLEADQALDFIDKTDIVRELTRLVNQLPDSIHAEMAGSPPLDDAVFRYTNRDFAVMGPSAALLILLISFIVFRRLSTAFILFAHLLQSCLWTFALMGALGLKLNLVSVALPAVIMAVGIADAIHLISDYYQHLAAGQNQRDSIVGAFTSVLTPCFYTTITTIAGMLSLLAGELAPLREFGALAAFGILTAFVLSMVFIPLALLAVKPPDTAFIHAQRSGPLNRLIEQVSRPSRGTLKVTLLAGIVILILSVWGIRQLTVGANAMNYFKKDDPMRLATEKVEGSFGGSASVELLVRAPNGGMKDPEKLQRVGEFSDWLSSQRGITDVLSILDSLKEVRRLFTGENALPDTAPMAAQSYLILEGEDNFREWVQEDYSVARLSGRARLTDAGELVKSMPRVSRKLAEDFPDGDLSIEPTGFVKLMADMEDYLVESQIRTFSLAFAVITLMMIFMLRSLRLGLMAMVPNLSPLLAGLGLMGWTGIPLDAGTVMVASIAMGLVVDDTVHMMTRIRNHLADGDTVRDAIHGAMHETGRAVIVTSIVLAGGFCMLLTGSFLPNVYFGLISAFVIVAALAADLFLLPAVLVLLGGFRRKPLG